MASLVAVALAACSSSEVETTPQTPQVQEFSGDSVVVFSSATNATRTSMGRDINGEGKIPFYWTINGERIWVKTGESSYAESDDFTITAADNSAADFIFHENLPGDDELPVLYTGFYSSSATSVSIWKDQVQTAWNNSDHIGHYGDCGTATATRTSRHKYTFQLEHKAAYLIFKPYKQAEITDDWRLRRIIITTTDGSSLCGTYPFSMDGIDINGVTSAKDTVYLYCGWNDGNTVSGFSIPTQESDVCFAVIQPGTHTNLKIKYEVMPTGTVNGIPNKTFSVFQTISVADYNPNSVTIISCDVSKGIMRFEPEDFDYREWGAMDTYVNTHDFTGYQNNGNYDKTTVPPSQLTSEGWKDLPNANEMSWYMLKGDMRIDTVALWYADGTGAHVGTYGFWIKKRDNIDGFNGDSSPYGVDLCSVENSDKQYIVGTEQVAYYTGSDYNMWAQGQYIAPIPDDDHLRLVDTLRHAGRPTDTTAYFFLPQISMKSTNTENYTLKGIGDDAVGARYWLRSPSKRANGTFGSTNYRRMAYAFRIPEPFSIADNPSDERRRFAYLSSWERRIDAGILAPKWFK